jgi:peptidyl-prolyl cis-trans isomerase D
VLIQGNNSQAVELGPQHVIVLRTLDHRKADVKQLEDVRAEIVDLLRNERAADKAREKGEALLERLRAGATLEQIAAETGHELKQPDAVRRDDTKLPANLVSAVFRLTKPAEQQPTYGGVVLDNQDFALAALSGVTEGTVSGLDESLLRNEETVLRRSRGRNYFDHLVRNLRNEAVVELR